MSVIPKDSPNGALRRVITPGIVIPGGGESLRAPFHVPPIHDAPIPLAGPLRPSPPPPGQTCSPVMSARTRRCPTIGSCSVVPCQSSALHCGGVSPRRRLHARTHTRPENRTHAYALIMDRKLPARKGRNRPPRTTYGCHPEAVGLRAGGSIISRSRRLRFPRRPRCLVSIGCGRRACAVRSSPQRKAGNMK